MAGSGAGMCADPRGVACLRTQMYTWRVGASGAQRSSGGMGGGIHSSLRVTS